MLTEAEQTKAIDETRKLAIEIVELSKIFVGKHTAIDPSAVINYDTNLQQVIKDYTRDWIL